MKLRLVICSVILVNVLSLNAQSLAEVARKERERREKEGKVTRTIKNEDLKNIQGARVTHGSSRAPRTETVVAGPGAPPSTEAAQAIAGTPDEIYWRSAFRDLRLRLQLAQNRGLVLELRVNDLRNRFFTESDGSTRTLIEQEMSKGREELEANRLEIRKAEEDLQKLEEAAKKANVPAGWMRGDFVPPAPAAAPAPAATPPAAPRQ